MKPRPLALIAGAVFALSFFLPAYSGSTGFKCFLFCWGLLCDFQGQSNGEPFAWLYYSAFVPTNLLFAATFALGLATPRFFHARLLLTVAAFLHVLSWLALNASEESLLTLEPGYFAWLLAYLLLFASLVLENKKKSAA
ncbi:MAG: hypothetical protein K0R17_3006 [Rariglobus sp.]|jgi:hypothetical protein|nr:hypothetical protein [Rariglobus sp.]